MSQSRLMGDVIRDYSKKISNPRRNKAVILKAVNGFVRLLGIVVIIASIASAYSIFTTFNGVLSGFPLYVPQGLVAGFFSVAVGTMLLKREYRIFAVCALVLLMTLILVGALPVTIGSAYLIPSGILAFLLFKNTLWEKRYALPWLTAVFLLWGMFVLSSWQPAVEFALFEPTGKGWGFDPIASLKMFYLMKQGIGYYKAYLISVALNAGVEPSAFQNLSFFAWRGPFLHTLWLLFPTGAYLYGAYLFLASGAIACGYVILSRSSRIAGLLGATILMPYFTLGLAGLAWWLEWEFWGIMFSIFAFTLYWRDKRKLAVVPAFFAAACKDTLAGALLGGLLGSLIRRDRTEILAWGTGAGAYLAYTALNYLNLKAFMKINFDASRWVGGGGLGFIESTFQFSLPWLPTGWTWILIVVAVIGVYVIRPRYLSVYAFANTMLPIMMFMMIGQRWDGYWGAVYVPYVLLMAVNASAVPLLTKTKGEKSRSKQSIGSRKRITTRTVRPYGIG